MQGAGEAGAGAPAEVARAHHGSVSRQERTQIEEALKAGRLPAVVATSSLELGIDMGAVDLVIQVESPPSVASGLQRTGRAGHNVGDVSRGVIFPKYQGDLVQAAVVARRMRDGAIEELRMPRNPLDVLAQQIVAMTAMDDWDVTELERTVRRAAPFAALTRPVLEAVLDMLAGRYPSEEFAGLRPRLVWDRTTGMLHGRPGGQRLAVTNGGTIPDRGLFGVFLAGGAARPLRPAFPPGRRAGRGDGLRVAGRRRVRARRELLADRGHHRRPGAGLARAGAAGPAAVLARRRARPPGRARPGDRRVLPRARRGRPEEATARLRARRTGRAGRGEPDQLPGRAARGDRLPARRPHPGDGAVPGRARRLAAGAAQPVRRAGARALGAGDRGPAARPLRRHGRAGAAHRRRHRDPGAGRRRPAARPGSPCSTRTRSSSW